MKLVKFSCGVIAIAAICFSVAQVENATATTYSEAFSSRIAQASYAKSGDVSNHTDIKDQYSGYENSGEELSFGRSTGCSTGCSIGCRY